MNLARSISPNVVAYDVRAVNKLIVSRPTIMVFHIPTRSPNPPKKNEKIAIPNSVVWKSGQLQPVGLLQ